MIENLTPQQSWELMQSNAQAVLIDVRTKMEHDFVGHPLQSVHIPWKEAPDWQINNDFVNQVKQVINDRSVPILLLCRSGQRSLEAAKLLETQGFEYLVNILDGFEGALDEKKHRGNISGWRYSQLPWEQS